MRSKLFVPAIRPELFEKALHSGADAICFDLEDAVAEERKHEARQHLRAFLNQRTPAAAPLLLVRTNPVGSVHFKEDIDACIWTSLNAIALPKVESVADVLNADAALTNLESHRKLASQIGILPTIESPRGLRLAVEIAQSSHRIIGLQLGFADLLEPLNIATTNQFARDQIRLQLRLATAEACVDCYDSAFTNIHNQAGYECELKRARELGFAGGSCIHPAQIPFANRAFTPTAEEIAFAQRVVDAAKKARRSEESVTVVDGRMIDAPFILRAQKILARTCSHNS